MAYGRISTPASASRFGRIKDSVGSIANPVDHAKYIIQALPRSLRYHIVYEFDPAAHVGGFPPGPERDRAQQRALEFQASLRREVTVR